MEGTVVIQFIVGKDGFVRNPRIVRDIGQNFGQAALDVIQLMIDQKIRWTPGKQRGRPVDVVMNLPIRIRIAD